MYRGERLIEVGYDTKEATLHRSMHNLTGCFVKEEEPEKVDDLQLFPIVLIFSQTKSKKYYASTKDDFKMWVNAIRRVIGYANILDYYELKVMAERRSRVG